MSTPLAWGHWHRDLDSGYYSQSSLDYMETTCNGRRPPESVIDGSVSISAGL